MKISVAGSTIQKLKASGIAFSEKLHSSTRYMRDREAIILNTDDFSPELLAYLKSLVRDVSSTEPRARSLRAAFRVLEKIDSDLLDAKIYKLEVFEEYLSRYLNTGSSRFWVYSYDPTSAVNSPFLVTSVMFVPRKDEFSPAKVVIQLKYILRSEIKERAVKIYKSDLGKTVEQILNHAGYYKETDDLNSAYDSDFKDYLKIRSEFGKQFLVTGLGYSTSKWGGSTMYLDRDGAPARMVNDEESIRKDLPSDQIHCDQWSKLSETTNPSASDDDDGEVYYTIPTHLQILMYHLDAHVGVWVDSVNVTEYVYDSSLREKIVLPEDVREFIDVLTAGMDQQLEDIIKGKTGGTIILAKGNPGTGKTLTAEVYSEIVKRPLYKVQSSQLGMTIEKLEEKLLDVLSRASRWGAILLIDEADVYIHERGTDILQNAVVGVFLRVLEYYNGLLFLTTNKTKKDGSTIDIDDAILSRCTAIIEYSSPDLEDSKKIWKILSTQFSMSLSDELISELSHTFPRLSGREIKNLLKLAWKYCKIKEVPYSINVFLKSSKYLSLNTDLEG